MKKHIIITIRYSLFMKTGAWVLSNKSLDVYRAEIFAPNRINNRQSIFANLTLPSLIGLNEARPLDVDFTVHILTSSELPLENAVYLNQLAEMHDFLEIKYHSYESASVTRDLKEYVDTRINEGEMYASVRLDDDDALSAHWINEVSRHLLPSFDQHVFSPSRGLGMILNDANEIVSIIPLGGRLLGCGLAYISMKTSVARSIYSIYECNNHTTIDHRFRTILYGKDIFWIRSFNSFNDSSPSLPKKDSIAPDFYLDELKIFNILELPFNLFCEAV